LGTKTLDKIINMPTPIIAKIDVKKINKEWLFTGTKGTYLDAVIYENDNVDQYGNSHVIKQNPPQEARAQGAKPVIIGNCRWMPQKACQQRPAPSKQQTSPATNAEPPESDSIPF
jgi:hypothetical protein